MCHDHVQMFLANFYDIEGFLFSILLKEQCFYMLLLLILGKTYCFCYIRRFMQLCFSGSGCTSMTSRALNWMRRWQLWPGHSSGGRAMGWRTWMTQLWTGFFESHQGSCKRRINGKGFKFDNIFFTFHILYWHKHLDSSNLQGSFGQGGIFQVQTEFM